MASGPRELVHKSFDGKNSVHQMEILDKIILVYDRTTRGATRVITKWPLKDASLSIGLIKLPMLYSQTRMRKRVPRPSVNAYCMWSMKGKNIPNSDIEHMKDCKAVETVIVYHLKPESLNKSSSGDYSIHLFLNFKRTCCKPVSLSRVHLGCEHRIMPPETGGTLS